MREKLKSIPQGQAVKTIQAGGYVQEGITHKVVDGTKQLVPILRLFNDKCQKVGYVNNTVFGYLIRQGYIRASDHPGERNVFVKAGS